MAIFTPQGRDATADGVVALLSGDPRIEGAVYVGSSAGGADRWSDVDLVAVLVAGADPAAVASGWVRRMYDVLPVLHHFETAFGATPVRGFLLADLLEVDLAFTRCEEFVVWGPARLAFDRTGRVAAALRHPVASTPDPPDAAAHAGIGWHDILHACTAIRRGRSWQGLWYLERVRSRALALAAARRGLRAEAFEDVDRLPTEEREPLEAALPPSLEERALLTAVEAATRGLLEELRRDDPGLADRLEGPLLELVRA